MTTALPTHPHHHTNPNDGEPTLPITIRHENGKEDHTERPATEHREIHLRFLHALSTGYVEIAAGRRSSNGELNIHTRHERDHFMPGGARGGPRWHEPLLELAANHYDAGQEVFIGVAPRVVRKGEKEDVRWTRCLWIDIDHSGHAQEIDTLLARFPAHLEIASAGGGGDGRQDGHRHLVWLLVAPHAARTVTDKDTGEKHHNAREVTKRTGGRGRPKIIGYRDLKTGDLLTNTEVVDWIERWNMRLVHHLGQTSQNGKNVYIADTKCKERARLLRLAGTRNMKTGRHARIVRVDRCLPPYDINTLVGDLPDPPNSRPVRRRDLTGRREDPYRSIPASLYFPVLANIDLSAKGNIHCPSPAHPDEKASCKVDDYVFYCHGCEAQGTLYDLWSLVNGGPTGDALGNDKPLFHRIAQEVRQRCRHLT